jgi:hypothetical protein
MQHMGITPAVLREWVKGTCSITGWRGHCLHGCSGDKVQFKDMEYKYLSVLMSQFFHPINFTESALGLPSQFFRS